MPCGLFFQVTSVYTRVPDKLKASCQGVIDTGLFALSENLSGQVADLVWFLT